MEEHISLKIVPAIDGRNVAEAAVARATFEELHREAGVNLSRASRDEIIHSDHTHDVDSTHRPEHRSPISPPYTPDKSNSNTTENAITQLHLKRSWKYLIVNWEWEILTWFIGSAALAVIVALLLSYKDAHLEQWAGRFQITTVIAALSQLSQSMLLVSLSAGLGQEKWMWVRRSRCIRDLQVFDEASRGPQGSLMLLFNGISWRSWYDLLFTRQPRRNAVKYAAARANPSENLFRKGDASNCNSHVDFSHKMPRFAFVGALAVTMMLGFSTFTQQTVAIVLRKDTVSATVPLLASAFSYRRQHNNAGADQTADAWDPDMNDAIASGLTFRTNSLSDISAPCETDDCTWKPYWTLGVCSQTKAISSDITSLSPLSFSSTSIKGPDIYLGNNDPLPSITFWMSSRDVGGQFGSETFESPTSDHVSLSETYLAYVEMCSGPEVDAHNMSIWTAFRNSLSLCVMRLNTTFESSLTSTNLLQEYSLIPFNTTEGKYTSEATGKLACVGTRIGGG